MVLRKMAKTFQNQGGKQFEPLKVSKPNVQ